jgi:hypothetical protein
MRLFALLIALVLATAFNPIRASAQDFNVDVNQNDPITGLSPPKWLKFALRIVHPEALVGLPVVLMINDTPEAITVNCGRWEIVGTQPYKSVHGNPSELKPFSITPIRTNEFDGYCTQKGSLVGSSLTNQYIGRMNDSEGNFSNATVVIFSAQ